MSDADKPLFAQTEALLRAIDRFETAGLKQMVDEHFGLVDVDPDGRTVIISDRRSWEAYLDGTLARLRKAGVTRSSTVLHYDAEMGREMAFSVVRYQQQTKGPERAHLDTCTTTIVWKLTEKGWKAVRWHCTLERREAA